MVLTGRMRAGKCSGNVDELHGESLAGNLIGYVWLGALEQEGFDNKSPEESCTSD